MAFDETGRKNVDQKGGSADSPDKERRRIVLGTTMAALSGLMWKAKNTAEKGASADSPDKERRRIVLGTTMAALSGLMWKAKNTAEKGAASAQYAERTLATLRGRGASDKEPDLFTQRIINEEGEHVYADAGSEVIPGQSAAPTVAESSELLPGEITFSYPTDKLPEPSAKEKGNPRGFKIDLHLNPEKGMYDRTFTYSMAGKDISKTGELPSEVASLITEFQNDPELDPAYLIVFLVENNYIPRGFAKMFFFKDDFEWTKAIQMWRHVVVAREEEKELNRKYEKLLKILNETIAKAT